MPREVDEDTFYKPAEVAEIFRVTTKTVARWVSAGAVPTEEYTRTRGGHLRIQGSWINRELKRN